MGGGHRWWCLVAAWAHVLAEEPTGPPAGLRHAVCLTGLQRDFPNIAVNVREFIFGLLGTPGAEITFFGVRPPTDRWAAVRRLLPMHVIEPMKGMCLPQYETAAQRRSLRSLIHCSDRGRSDCHGGFPFEMCALAHCEAMISAHERAHGRPFHTVYRLRADLQLEAPMAFPSPLDEGAVYVPWMNRASGVNDQAAFGGRRAMRQYLTRGPRYLTVPNITVAQVMRGVPRRRPLRPGERISTEMFLQATLHRDGLRVVERREWMYCTHNFKSFLDRAAAKGCITRSRRRTRCASLVCPRSNMKYWCTCHNETCASIAAGAPVRSLPAEGPSRRRDGGLRDGSFSCADVRGRQLLVRSCPFENALEAKKQPGCRGRPCDLPERTAANETHIAAAGAPSCIFESRAANAVAWPLQ